MHWEIYSGYLSNLPVLETELLFPHLFQIRHSSLFLVYLGISSKNNAFKYIKDRIINKTNYVEKVNILKDKFVI